MKNVISSFLPEILNSRKEAGIIIKNGVLPITEMPAVSPAIAAIGIENFAGLSIAFRKIIIDSKQKNIAGISVNAIPPISHAIGIARNNKQIRKAFLIFSVVNKTYKRQMLNRRKIKLKYRNIFGVSEIKFDRGV